MITKNLNSYDNEGVAVTGYKASIIDKFLEHSEPVLSHKLHVVLKNMKISDVEWLVATFGTVVYAEAKRNYVVTTEKSLLLLNVRKRGTFLVITGTLYDIGEEHARFMKLLKPYIYSDKIVTIRWYMPDNHGGIDYDDIMEPLGDVVYPEAYPNIGNLDSYLRKYTTSSASVLILKGPPGTGKTKFIRYLLQQADYSTVGYTFHPEVIDAADMYRDLLRGDTEAVVLEDIDAKMQRRTDGNNTVISLLNAADGVISSIGRKIIISTNLPNVTTIDPALMRPGRCFDVLEFERLSAEEAVILGKKILGTEDVTASKAGGEYTLAEIYRTCQESEGAVVIENYSVEAGFGFGKG